MHTHYDSPILSHFLTPINKTSKSQVSLKRHTSILSGLKYKRPESDIVNFSNPETPYKSSKSDKSIINITHVIKRPLIDFQNQLAHHLVLMRIKNFRRHYKLKKSILLSFYKFGINDPFWLVIFHKPHQSSRKPNYLLAPSELSNNFVSYKSNEKIHFKVTKTAWLY